MSHCPNEIRRDSPGCATCGVNVSSSDRVCVFTRCTQSGSNTFHYLPTGVLKEVSGLAERTRPSRPSNYQLCYICHMSPLRLSFLVFKIGVKIPAPQCCWDPLDQWSPTFLAPGTSSMEDNFSKDLDQRDGSEMIQAHYIYCVLNFYHYYISSTSDHQILEPGVPCFR